MTDLDRPPVPQRLVIVVPTTGEFDSRTWRIATTCAKRGHTVTVIARAAPNLPAEETHPGGYRILRVDSDPWSAVATEGFLRRWTRRVQAPSVDPTTPSREAMPARAATMPARLGLRRRARAGIRGAVRLAAIWLTIRAQTRAARTVDPAADLYHGMAYMGIPVAADLARRHGAPVIYDARDIYIDAGNLARLPRPIRRFVGWQERGRARAASRVVTVNRPYAEVMAARWAVELPLIVLNCSPSYTPARPQDRRFHHLLGLPGEMTVVLYQGGLSPDRGIEQLIAAIVNVPDAVLVLMGYGSLRDQLERAAGTPGLAGRVRLIPPVPPHDLLDWIAAADIVAMPIQPTTLNHRLTTPNKLFEAMAAGVPVVASDLPGMAPIVREADIGLLVDPTDPNAIAAAIRRLVADPSQRVAMGDRALQAAHDRYNWERQAEILMAEYGRLTGRPW